MPYLCASVYMPTIVTVVSLAMLLAIDGFTGPREA
jgi:hypothetical protein